MFNHQLLQKLSIDPHFYMGVTRNPNATSRMDNPYLVEDDEVYQGARAEFINELRQSFEGDESLRCEKCGIALPAGYHIHHNDGDHTNNNKENFRLRDPFCHLSSHLGFVGVNNMATVVYVPQIPQALLNQIQIIAYAYEHILNGYTTNSKQYAKLSMQQVNLKTLLQSIEATKAVVYRNFQTNDPLHFANIFTAMSEDEYQNRAFKTDSTNQLSEMGTFAGLRLLFEPSKFEKEIKNFAKHVLMQEHRTHENNPSSWFDAAKLLKQRGKNG
ncbi:HNH endonuclease [Vibrio harveyi]|uniref:HNH endonuclease n=1 Tax=Vibrio harveyi TaxID=669 RepID=UPI00248031F4|nr:HNH endonuclease [Vibrio harveyi]